MTWLFLICLWVLLLAYFRLPRKFVRRFYVPPVLIVLVGVYTILSFIAWFKWHGGVGLLILLDLGYCVLAVAIYLREMRNAIRYSAKSNLQVSGKLIEMQGKVGTIVGSAVGGPVGTVVGSVGGAGLQAVGRAYINAGDRIITYDQTAYDRLRNKAIENGINVDGLDIEGIAQKVISCASKAGVYEITQANPGITAVDLATQLICANRS